MPINHLKLRQLFVNFWKKRAHKESPPISLVPQNDPTTLFTGSGMQPLVPYLLGEPHPLGKRLYNIQPCFRSQDIEEVGDNRHTTFFEMMGNWSLGDYFKEEQLTWFWQFLTKELNLPQEKLYVSIFAGAKFNHGSEIPADYQSLQIWKKLGVPENRIFQYGTEKNWWSRAGEPEKMPPEEPGGPDSEVFYDFGKELGLHEKSPYANQPCHPNCDCGRFLEIGNSVFMEYKKLSDGGFNQLSKKNVDFGGGLERILAALNDNPDIFVTDVYQPIIQSIEKVSYQSYQKSINQSKMRIIADHLKAATFLIEAGILPSNKERGYVLRRLLRRTTIKMFQLKGKTIEITDLSPIIESIINIYKNIYFNNSSLEKTQLIIKEEINRFNKTLKNGLKMLDKAKTINGKFVFDLYQSFGFPPELTEELLKEKGLNFNKKEFYAQFAKHKQISRAASLGKFKGGLADHQKQTIKYHTATHLLHQALIDIINEDIRQEGSNITAERLRFDFYSPKKPTLEEIKQVETIINQKINQSLPVFFKIMTKEEAERIKAKSFFREKYPPLVKIYFIGGSEKSPLTAYSKEFCGGPHVQNTKEIGKIEIFKFEKIGGNLYRIYAK